MLEKLFENREFNALDPEITSMGSTILVLEPPEGILGPPVICFVSWHNETTDVDIMWELAKYGTLVHSLYKGCEQLEPLWKISEGGHTDLVGPQTFLEEWLSKNINSLPEREIIPTILNNWATLVVLATGMNPDLVKNILNRKSQNYHVTINLNFDYTKQLHIWASSEEELLKELEEVALIHARKKWLEVAEDEATKVRKEIFGCVPQIHRKKQ